MWYELGPPHPENVVNIQQHLKGWYELGPAHSEIVVIIHNHLKGSVSWDVLTQKM